jgi:hypothetical protein
MYPATNDDTRSARKYDQVQPVFPPCAGKQPSGQYKNQHHPEKNDSLVHQIIMVLTNEGDFQAEK